MEASMTKSGNESGGGAFGARVIQGPWSERDATTRDLDVCEKTGVFTKRQRAHVEHFIRSAERVRATAHHPA